MTSRALLRADWLGYDWRLILNMLRIDNWSQLTVVDSRRQSDVVVSSLHVCTTQFNSTQLIPTASWVELLDMHWA